MAKDNRVEIRVSAEDLSNIKRAAGLQNKSISEFIREIAAEQARLIVLASEGKIGRSEVQSFASVAAERTIASVSPSIVHSTVTGSDKPKRPYTPFDSE